MVFAEVFVGFGGIRDGKSWLDCGRFVVNRGVLYGAVQAPRTCTLPVAIADSDVALSAEILGGDVRVAGG